MAERVNLSALAKRFGVGFAGKFESSVRSGLTMVGQRTRDTVVLKFGHYQPAIASYPSWPHLAPATLKSKLPAAGKVRGDLFQPRWHGSSWFTIESGNTFDDPLIGHYTKGRQNKVWPAHLRNTIEINVTMLSVAIGTRDPLGPIHEFGTTEGGHSIPPRPFLRPAWHENFEYFRVTMQYAVGSSLFKL